MTVHAGDSPERSVAARPGRPGHRAIGSKLLASIVDSSDDAILSKTLDGVITSWNKAAERIYGYQAEEIIGRSVSLLMPPDHPDEMAEILNRIRIGERVGHYETTRRVKDGTTIAISLTVSPIRDASGGIVGASSIAHIIADEAGNVLGAFATARDVTAQKRAESEVAKRRARELERLAELERFQRLTVGRELRMIELKKEIEDLRATARGE
jgi:PAS domain S-box-containing protein